MTGSIKIKRRKARFFHAISIPLLIGINIMASSANAEFSAARDTVYFTLPPSPEVLASHLFGDEPKHPLTRSISFKKSTTQAVSAPKTKSVTMPILFHFGKTTIINESRPFLDNVGEMLISPANADRALIVEGHTDAVGPSEFNQTLSELRALAIRDYLVNNFAIDPLRLMPIGRGESSLYDTINPKSGENRRVEFMPQTKS